MKLYVIEGGVGKQIAFTSLLEGLTELTAVASNYPEVYKDIPLVIAYDLNNTNMDTLFMRNFEKIFDYDPYRGTYLRGDYHLLDAFQDITDLKYNKNKKPYLPYIPIQEMDIKKKTVVVQFFGGGTVVNNNGTEPYEMNAMRQGRNYDYGQEIVNYLLSENYDVIQMGLPNEPKLNGCAMFEIPIMEYLDAVKKADFVVGIDSALLHMAAGVGTKAYALWGMNKPEQLSYEGVTDFVTDAPNRCMIDPNKVISAIQQDINDKNNNVVM